MTVNIDINMDKKCAECRKPGAVDSGICLKCTIKAFDSKPMKSQAGRMVQSRIHAKRGNGLGNVFANIDHAVNGGSK